MSTVTVKSGKRKKKATKVVIQNNGKRKRVNKVRKPKTTVVVNKAGEEVLVQRLPHCSIDYGNALANPFDTPGGVCIPYGDFPFRSQKNKTFIRSRFALGTTGFGYVSILPTIVNDVATVKVTQATSVGGSSTLLGSYTNLVDHFNTQLPYTAANITGNQLQGRIVACGHRIKYVGALANRNGTVVGMEEPDHRNIPSIYSFDTLSTNPYSIMERIGPDEWDMTVCYSGPSDPAHFEYLNSTTPLNSAQFMVIAVSGTAGDVYEFEYYQHTEYIGQLAVAKTASHVDKNIGAVLEGVKAQTADKPLQPKDAPSIWNTVKQAISDSLPTVVRLGTAAYNTLVKDPNTSVSPKFPTGMLGMAMQAITHPGNGMVNMPNNNPLRLEGVRLASQLEGRPRMDLFSDMAHSIPHKQRRNTVYLG
jgi:hypothetical protein